jgi:site-specific recombinase XerD
MKRALRLVHWRPLSRGLRLGARLRTRRNILERFREAHGDKRIYFTDASGKKVVLLTREHMQQIVNAKAETPFAQRNFLNTMRALSRWAKSEGTIPDDPTLGVTRKATKTTGYKTWSEGNIETFEAAHRIGSRARLALALALYTGQRLANLRPRREYGLQSSRVPGFALAFVILVL